MGRKECERLTERQDEFNHIAMFLEWLQEQKIWLCNLDKEVDHWYPIAEHYNPDLIYKYMKINPTKLEQERRELLEELKKKG